MRLRTVRESYERGDVFTLYPLGDIHLGSANCDKTALFDLVTRIRTDPLARWIGMGDYMEWISKTDKRFASGGIDDSIVNLANLDRIGDVYVEKIGTILRPIMDKCWAMGKGNHETHFEQNNSTELVPRIIKEAGGDPGLYTGWAGMTRIAFKEGTHHSSIKVFHSHGWQAGRLSGAKVNQLDHMTGWIDGCRIYLQGHSHDNVVKMKTKLEADNSHCKLRALSSFGAHTSSFLRTYEQDTDGYGERGGYPPVPIGGIWFQVKPEEAGVKARAIQGDMW